MAIINGTAGKDYLSGTDLIDTIYGFDGDDDLSGMGGGDVIYGGYGCDELHGQAGSDKLYGEADADKIYGGLGNDLLSGGGGNDQLNGDEGNDTLQGDLGNDGLSGGAGADRLIGGDGYDSLYGGDGDDKLYGGAADDYLDGGAGNDLIDGGSTNEAGAPADWRDEDTVFFGSATKGVAVDLAAGTASDGTGGTDTLVDIEAVRGTNYDDILKGGNAANDGYEGFTGGEGNDEIDGGSGFDVVYYNSTYQYDTPLRGIVADLATGIIKDNYGGTDTVSNVEKVFATQFADRLLGSALDDQFAPGGGKDYIDGRDGSDTVDYSRDSYSLIGRGLNADLGRGTIYDVQNEIDTVVSIENVTGSRIGDTIRGDINANTLDGYRGDDLLKGRSGADVLLGGDGSDHLDGGYGTDRLDGGTGNDTLRGGYGSDVFVFGKDMDEDHILDFKTGTDKIDVKAFGFASAADVLALLTPLGPGAAMLTLPNDSYVIFDYVDSSKTVLAAGDIVI